MRKLMLAIGAASLLAPAALVLPATSAQAQHRHYRGDRYHHHGRDNYYHGRNRRYCRKSDGTAGTIVGGVAGALLGRTIDTHGNRTTGTVLGAAGGALAGHALDSNTHCR